jgi:cytochrome c biogenesis protein CcmG/thiol:disulfide interchange protein DsbE
MNRSAGWLAIVRVLVLLLGIAGVAAVRGLPAAMTGLPSAHDRKPAPDFTLTDANGAPVTLSGYRGRVVLLDFWATWCTGCKVEIPWYVEFQKKYARRGLTSIGVAMDEEGWEKVKPYLDEHPIGYPIVLGNPALVMPYQIENMPVTLLIDRHGRIADAHVGMVVKATWEKEIRRLLGER